jgi:predicted SnoaL-like aldol condensation-catalyzing enzyme
VETKELVTTFFDDVFTHGRLDRCDDIAAPTYIEHAIAPFGGDEPGPVSGPDHLKDTARWLREQFPDITMRIEHVVEEGGLCCRPGAVRRH